MRKRPIFAVRRQVRQTAQHSGNGKLNPNAALRAAVRDFHASLPFEPLESRVMLSAAVDWTFASYTTAQLEGAGPFNAEVNTTGYPATASRASVLGTTSASGNGQTNALASNKWVAGAYYQFQINTTGTTPTSFQFDQAGSNTGPRDFEVQYSTTGNFTTGSPGTGNITTAIPVTYYSSLWTATSSVTGFTTTVPLASLASTLSNQPTVYFRVTDLDATSIVNGAVGTAGSDRIDNVIINEAAPVIGSLTVNPATVTQGVNSTISLTANNVTDSVGTVSNVNFYANGNTTPLSGNVTNSNGNWTLSGIQTSGFAAGTITYTAQATDNLGDVSNTVSGNLSVQAAVPYIGSLTVNPSSISVGSGTTLTLTANNVTDTGGTPTQVAFYENSTSSTPIGYGTNSSGNWTLSSVSTSNLTAGSTTFYAIAKDSASQYGPSVSTTLTVNNPQPVADWTFETSQPTTAGPITPEAGSGNATVSHAGSTTYTSPAGNGSPHSYNSTNWAAGDYYQFEVNTTGLNNIGFQFDQSSSSTGPGTYTLEYSTDGTAFTPFSGNITSAGTTVGTTTGNYAVPVNGTVGAIPNLTWNTTQSAQSAYTFVPNLSSIQGVIDNQPTLYFRLVDANAIAAGSGAVATAGTDRVDNVIVTSGSSPSIGSVAANPASIVANTPTTISLTARNVTDPNPNGVVTGVTFYENGVSIGNGTQSGGNWTLPGVYVTAVPLNNPTFSAIAQDSQGEQSSAVNTTLTLTQSVVADWTFENSQPTTTGPIAPEGGTEASASAASAYHALASTISSPSGDDSPHSLSSNDWSTGDYYQFQTDTAGEANIQLDFNQTSSSTGPGQFALYYSPDGTNYTQFTGNITSNSGATTSPYTTATAGNYNYVPPANSGNTTWSLGPPTLPTTEFHVDLSSVTALNNNSTVYFRLEDASTISNGNGVTATGGTDRVDNVAVSGTDVVVPSIGALTVSPNSIVVGSGTAVTLTASNITDANATVTGVKFYAGSATGMSIGSGTNNNGNWTLSGVSTSSLPSGSEKYYAIATDSLSLNSAADSTTLTVTGTQQVSFDATSYSVNEIAGTVSIQVDRTAPAGYNLTGNATVNYATIDGTHFGNATQPNVDGGAVAGTDYTYTAGTLHFNNGATSATITVPIDDVATFAGTRTFDVTLSQALSSPATLGGNTTAAIAVTDNTVDNADGTAAPTPSGAATAANTVSPSTVTASGTINPDIPLAYANHNSFPVASFPEIEFGSGSSVFPGTYTAGNVDSVKLSLYNTSTSSGESGVPGTFAVYLLSSDSYAASSLTYGESGDDTASSVLSKDYGAFTDGFSAGDLVGTASFTNNAVGYNDFTFDNLTTTVRGELVNYFDGSDANPIRFVIVPTSQMSVNWYGLGPATNEQPQLTLLATKGTPEEFGLSPLTDANATSSTTATIVKGGTGSTNSETITLTRSGLNNQIDDTATVPYTLSGSDVIGTDYTVTGVNGTTTNSGNFTFAKNQASAQIIITAIAGTPLAADTSVVVSVGTPMVGDSSHTGFESGIASQTVTIHDPLTMDSTSVFADDTGDVYQNGVPANSTGHAQDYVDVQAGPNGTNPGNGSSDSFGVLDYNEGTGNGNDITNGAVPEIGSINQVTLNTANYSNTSSYETAGLVDVYITDATAVPIDPGASTLTYKTSDTTTTGLGMQLDAGNLNPAPGTSTSGLYLLGTIAFSPTQPAGVYTPLTVTPDPSYGAASFRVLANDINNGSQVRFVLTPAPDSNVAAQWYGENFEQVAPTVSLNFNPLSDFVSNTGNVNWNAATENLNVNNSTTINRDPGIFNLDPNVFGNSSASQLLIQPITSPTDVHLGGVTLTSGAGIDVASVGADRSNDNHNVLVIGTVDQPNDPIFNIDSASSLNLEDNDMVLHAGLSDNPGETLNASAIFAEVQSAATLGRNGAAAVTASNNGTIGNFYWAGNGLNSSVAANVDGNDTANGADYEDTALAVATNGALQDPVSGLQLSAWTVGSAVESLSTTGNDVVVKYTYVADVNLDGKVDGSDQGIQSGNYGLSGPFVWTDGDCDDNGTIDGNDIGILSGQYGMGTPSTGTPEL